MRIVRPYGESIAPAAGSERVLRPKQQLRALLGAADRRIPPFAAGHDELVLAQWISTIDKIATKPKGRDKPTRDQRTLRDKLGQACWSLLVDQKLLPGLPNDEDGYLGKLWWFKIHPYPRGTAKPRRPKSGERKPGPNPRGRWYQRFVGDVEPGAIDAAAVAAHIHEHLHEREYRHGTAQKHDKGRIERRAESIARNVASLDQVTKALDQATPAPPKWTAADIETYRRAAGDVAETIKRAAEAREKQDRRVGADVAAAVLYPAFASLFPGKGIDEALAEAPGLAALHVAIRDFYRRCLKRHEKQQVARILPATLDGLLEKLDHGAANREVAALVRLGKVVHYEAALEAARNPQKGQPGAKAAEPKIAGDAPAHVLDHWPADVRVSVYWGSAGQAEIKRNEAFVRVWRHALALAAQTARDWGSPDGAFDDDVLLGKGITELPARLDLDHHARKLAVLFGSRAEALFLEGRDETFQRNTLKLALEGLAQLRHNSFHFNGRGSFARALESAEPDAQTGQAKVTADQDLWQVLGDLWTADLKDSGKRLVDTLKAAHLDHFFDLEHNQRLIAKVARAKLTERAQHLPLPRFRRLLDRAANAEIHQKDIELRLPKPVNRLDMEEFPAVRAKYVGLKLLYENPFRQWVEDLAPALIKSLIDAAIERADQAAKRIFGGKDTDVRDVVTAKVKNLGGLAAGEKLKDFYFRLSRETASEMRVQRGYESNGEAARKQAAFIEELLIDVLAQAFRLYLLREGFAFLARLADDTHKPPQPQCELKPPKLDLAKKRPPRWQHLLYFLLHLIPVDDVGRLLHQLRKWDITAGKAAGTELAGDPDVDRVMRTLTLYLDMHDAKFIGTQALGGLDSLHELYRSKETFENFFLQQSRDEDQPIPRRGLREILRFGHLPPLRSIFADHQVTDQTVQEVQAVERDGTLARAQRERERLHEKWVEQRDQFDAADLERYVRALREVTRHRHDAAHVRLVDHAKLHRLMLAVLGRLLDFAGLYERDLYFAMLALIYNKKLSPQSAFNSEGRRLLRRGQIIEARRKLKDQAIEKNLARLFGRCYGKEVDSRNNLAHFNMLNIAKSGGAAIDLTAEVNAARRMMTYDRKLKNAVAQSVIELVAREGLALRWQVRTDGGEHRLAFAVVSRRQATHLGETKIEVKGGGDDQRQPLTEPLTSPHLVAMAARLFLPEVDSPVHDTTAPALETIDWQASAASILEKAESNAHPPRPTRSKKH